MRFDNVKKNKESEQVIVAVYGFLRKGLENHHHIQNGEFLGRYNSLPEYTLYDINGFPGLEGNGFTSACIEVYAISKSDFVELEWFNNLEGNTQEIGNTTSIYTTDTIGTPFGNAIVFFIDPFMVPLKTAKVVENGDWEDYLISHRTVRQKSLFEMIEINN